MDRITVISFGPLGLSIGLGLARLELNDTEIVASSGSSVWRAQAKKSGAFARIEPNLANVLKDTDLIVVDVPTVDVPGLFKVFGEKLNDAVIVTDTGLPKRQTIEWAQEYLGQRIQFVGGTPLPMKRMVSIDDAHGDAFVDSDYCIVPSDNATPGAIKMVVGLAEGLGAQPLFISADEHDSYTTATTLLPRILSSALMTSLSKSQSWPEVARLAGSELENALSGAGNDPDNTAADLGFNTDHVEHWLQGLINELSAYKDAIAHGESTFEEALTNAWEQRSRWKAGALRDEPALNIPSTKETMMGMFLGRRLARKINDMPVAAKEINSTYDGRKVS